MRFTYKMQNTCAPAVSFDLNGNVITNVQFVGGCDGNLKAIGVLVEGMTAEELVTRCTGITCGRKSTSCPDQLTRAVRAAMEAQG